MNELLTGAVTGILFGFFMQKAQVIRYDRQLAALRLQDMTIVKFMLSTILVAMVGIYLLFDLGLIKLSVKPLILGGNVLGGLIFGLGWGIVGYCPATAMGALGEGRYDSAFGLLGMLLGAGLYAEAYPLMKETVLTWGNFGKITLPAALGINHWIVIVILVAVFIALFRWFEKKGL
ncbi:MAG: YeeE/YedE thiosulfate transporter family protein [Syntrophales bacterium]|nr:YeeE/YedE thiosulfate transporter family protein [Syntrophales bacterium]MDP3098618.1 YeeE/YedE thiosulfate transporter family protein [Syntrophales bacterium]